MDTIRVAIFAKEESVQKTLAKSFHSPSIKVIGSSRMNRDEANQILTGKPNVIVIFYDGIDDSIYSFAERLYAAHEAQAIFIVADNLTVKMVQRAVLCGANNVIEYDRENTQIEKPVLETVSRELGRENDDTSGKILESKVITIFGTKGGVGKTTVAVNLAVALANAGRRVALLDLDLQFGDVSVFLNIQKYDSIVDVVSDNAYTFKSLKTYMTTHYTGIDVLCAPPTPEQADAIHPEDIQKVIAALKSNYDFLIIDLPPQFDDNTIAALKSSTIIYSVVNPDISSLKNASVSFNVLNSLQCSDKVRYVISKGGCSTITEKQIEVGLKHQIAADIPFDIDAALLAVNNGVPLIINSPKSKITESMAKFVTNEFGSTAISQKQKKHGLFAKH